jgi:hypothetical protein
VNCGRSQLSSFPYLRGERTAPYSGHETRVGLQLIVMRNFPVPALGFSVMLLISVAPAQQVDIASGSIVETVKNLHAGEYVWAPRVAPEGPTLLVVNLKNQRAILYRNGVPIGASTVSTGRTGYRTPTGVFTILQKHVEHYSSKYDNAPMPYMQRLTWYGIALHAGQLPGYPASHGCIRLPLGFAKLLYGATRVGMTIVITEEPTIPRLAPQPYFALADRSSAPSQADQVRWQPERAPAGPVSVVVSAADSRAVVLRNGIEIGSAPVHVQGPVTGSWVYTLRSIDKAGQHQWLRVPLARTKPNEQVVPHEEWRRFDAPEGFKRAVASILEPGTTIVVTQDSLRAGATGSGATVIEAEPGTQ